MCVCVCVCVCPCAMFFLTHHIYLQCLIYSKSFCSQLSVYNNRMFNLFYLQHRALHISTIFIYRNSVSACSFLSATTAYPLDVFRLQHHDLLHCFSSFVSLFATVYLQQHRDCLHGCSIFSMSHYQSFVCENVIICLKCYILTMNLFCVVYKNATVVCTVLSKPSSVTSVLSTRTPWLFAPFYQ